MLYFLFLKIINRGNGEPQETRNINDKMLSLSSIIKNKYELYKGRFQVKGRRDSGTKQKREIDQTFHLCSLRNKTSLFALQSHSNFQKLANTMFNDKSSDSTIRCSWTKYLSNKIFIWLNYQLFWDNKVVDCLMFETIEQTPESTTRCSGTREYLVHSTAICSETREKLVDTDKRADSWLKCLIFYDKREVIWLD